MLPNLPLFTAPHYALRFLALSASSAVAAREIITGYGDHQRRISDMASGPQADNRFLIGQLAHEFVRRWKSAEPVREIQIIGHSDRVWVPGGGHNSLDEKKVSEERAHDARSELLHAILTDPTPGGPTAVELLNAIHSGELTILTAGLGASHPLAISTSGAVPENRRVEILLLLTQSVPI